MMHEIQQMLVQFGRDLRRGSSVLFNFLTFLLVFLLLPCQITCISSDGLALLQFKKAIKHDPLKVLSNWKEDDSDPCWWTGVTCDAKTSRVISLNITGPGFCGWAGAFERSDGMCGSFTSCPSLFVQSSETQCWSWEVSSTEVPYNGTALVCLKNGTVLNSSFGYAGIDQVPCRLTGSLSPAIGNLSQLRTLALPFNSLFGGIPKEIALLQFLEVLDLQGNALSGAIPRELGQLSGLQILNLAYNSLEDELPSELSGCRSIQVFNLAGNLLSGKIPLFLGSLPELTLLTLSFNQLDGTIPLELASSCNNLEHLNLEGNFLIGTIPPELGNCSQLKSVMLSSNFLSGAIPPDLGRLSMLQSLDVSRNSLAGEIPTELGNCPQLSLLVLTNLLDIESCINRTLRDPLDGYSNKDKGEFNYFTGALPESVVILPRLRILWAPRAGLNGVLPSYWGSCQSLEVLNLGGNMFTGKIPSGLGRCRSLIYLDLSSNELEGGILQQLSIPCMVVFNVSANSLSGAVSSSSVESCPGSELLSPHFLSSASPLSLGDIRFSLNTVFSYFRSLYCGSVSNNLPAWLAHQVIPVVHDVSNNNFSGTVPGPLLGPGLVDKHPSYSLFLSGNAFSGAIPRMLFDICQDFQAFAVGLSQNFLSGELPKDSMVSCKSLIHFEASSNHLLGTIPRELGELSHLVYLDLGLNNFSGVIPSEVGGLLELEYLVLANNSLTGRIPSQLGGLASLIVLNLSANELTGEIPGNLANLRRLKDLILNNNCLSGSIPLSFTNFTSLVVIDVAFNNLSGMLPRIGNLESLCTGEHFAGNPLLQACLTAAPTPSSQPLDVPRSVSKTPNTVVVKRSHRPNSIVIAAITSSCAIVIVLSILALVFQCTKQQTPTRPGYHSGRKEVVTFGSINFHLTYESVVRATGNFSIDNLIGNGGFGATYKAELIPGLLVAVKRLSLGRFQGIQQFDAEIRTLGRIRHPHLVTLIGYHASETEMFLIYNYLPGGNLESLIHDSQRGNITWRIRYKIALDIAQALAYLHDECTPRVLHRDIKPSNILLDNSLNAYLSDFGLARLLGASETHATTDVAGTFGYVAPEYAMTCRVSDKADVYSYGVVLLELLSGKRALDPSFSHYGDGFNIVAWACHLLEQGQARELYAPGLWDHGFHSQLVEALKLAVTCTVDSLSVRPTMKQVVDSLKLLRL